MSWTVFQRLFKGGSWASWRLLVDIPLRRQGPSYTSAVKRIRVRREERRASPARRP
jgi:hypothetical protein